MENLLKFPISRAHLVYNLFKKANKFEKIDRVLAILQLRQYRNIAFKAFKILNLEIRPQTIAAVPLKYSHTRLAINCLLRQKDHEGTLGT